MVRAEQYQMPPGETPDKLVARVPKSLAEEIRGIADKREVSLNIVMVEAFEQYIQREAGK